MEFKDISIEDFKEEFKDSELLIDIRDQDSYNHSNIPNSQSYNSEDIMNLVKEGKRDVKIVVYCYHGNSSRKVASFLSENGFKSVYSLIGGFDAWKDSL